MPAITHLPSPPGLWIRLSRALRAAIQRWFAPRRPPSPIRTAAERLDREGAVVFARASGFPVPPVINGYRPDVYAVYDDREVALSVSTEESAEGPASERQDLAFATWAEEAPEREYAQIVVPGSRR